MHSQVLLLALASTAAAYFNPAQIAARAVLEARQTQTESGAAQTTDPAAASCLSAVNALVTHVPDIPNEITGLAATQSVTNPCDLVIPSSVSSIYWSVESEFRSWQSQYLPQLVSVVEECPQYSSLLDNLDGTGCSTRVRPDQTSAPGSQATGAGNGTGSGGGNDPGKNSGHRETGLIGAAVAVAGFLGVMAVL